MGAAGGGEPERPEEVAAACASVRRGRVAERSVGWLCAAQAGATACDEGFGAEEEAESEERGAAQRRAGQAEDREKWSRQEARKKKNV